MIHFLKISQKYNIKYFFSLVKIFSKNFPKVDLLKIKSGNFFSLNFFRSIIFGNLSDRHDFLYKTKYSDFFFNFKSVGVSARFF